MRELRESFGLFRKSENSPIWTTLDPKRPFKRYVEIEKVALTNYGKGYRKLGVIVDVIDQNRATIGALDMVRNQINFKRLRYGPKSQKVVEKEVESRNLAGSDVGDKGDPTPLVQEVPAQLQQALFEQMSECGAMDHHQKDCHKRNFSWTEMEKLSSTAQSDSSLEGFEATGSAMKPTFEAGERPDARVTSLANTNQARED
ncbi:uncharacterized protein LOC131180093 [Hevea brasiliensis]|uniref:uncharacterized protein LOC131180093 n=1 Tax=Hevea brasiliensis TaxID=3981 RepID=UPI0025E73C7D|nr:uncharacterized protein LOC131180093 [Hevea brasiliensis]